MRTNQLPERICGLLYQLISTRSELDRRFQKFIGDSAVDIDFNRINIQRTIECIRTTVN